MKYAVAPCRVLAEIFKAMSVGADRLYVWPIIATAAIVAAVSILIAQA